MAMLPERRAAVVKQQNYRKELKKQRLKEARAEYPFKMDFSSNQKVQIVKWLIDQRLKSWKQYGSNGDYFLKGSRIRFKNEKDFVTFKLRWQ